ncbi:putative pectinesterase 10 [Phoenix dactylifera]|uniref:Pectinesterase n=1 Tax=Phoenix dactylifera TaxID=42345 RepID=A0A8B8J238_PHODC|nr:putative pectinesterase 10 [Phoenix dactylifera]
MKWAFSLFFLVVFVSVTLHVHQASGAANIVKSIIVDLNGKGDFKTIQEAINSVPANNNQWIRIHVSAGVYREKVHIQNDQQFILLEGEGRDQTVIEWGDYASDPGKHTTITSATFTSSADNFVAKYITFKNSAQNVGQAVAASIQGNHSAFYGCGFIGVQDTLYDQFGLHYFKECYIEGAVDFIFGCGQSIYEKSLIYTVQRAGVVTAQGRESPTDENGFVFKGCVVNGTHKASLGRAWRNYARVIFYKTFMSDIVDPEGWNAWGGKEEDTTFVESGCHGPGSDTSQRVKWMKKPSPAELRKFTHITYIDSEGWISAQP